jgi:hypothetical protein
MSFKIGLNSLVNHKLQNVGMFKLSTLNTFIYKQITKKSNLFVTNK